MQRLTASGLSTGKTAAAESMTTISKSKAWKVPGRLPVIVKAQGGASNGGSSNGNNSNNGVSSSATLAAHRTWLRRQRVLHSEPHPSDGDIIELNVAGCIMVATRSTLKQVPGSLLHLLFDPANSAYLVSDPAGRIFFDYDPAAFALVLRYLRELRVTGGCTSAVLFPPIPPHDAGPFRSLVSHLGLQIDEAAITAATARGAAIAAAAGGGSSSSNNYASRSAVSSGGYHRPSGSPYASRPAAGSVNSSSRCAQSHPQPHQPQWWWQQQQLLRPQPPEVPPSGIETASKSGIRSSSADGCASRGSSSVRHNGAAAPTAAAGPGATGAKQQRQQASAQLAEPVVQYFYLKTSKAQQALKGSPGGSVLPGAPPLHVTVLAENDILAQQASSSSKGSSNSVSGIYSSNLNRGLGSGPAPGWGLLSGFDAFCSTSSSKQLMVFSVVTRGSANVDNVFVGVTSSNHTDQRGLQIPSFGWRQVDVTAAASSSDDAHCSAVTWDMQTLDNSTPGSETLANADSSTGSGTLDSAHGGSEILDNNGLGSETLGKVDSSTTSGTLHSANGGGETLDDSSGCSGMLWQCGDLVQLMLELGTTNKLILKVNGYEVKGCYIDLPTFRQWCWYVAFFRGTEVVSVVLEQGSVSVYAGDHMLKRYLA